MLRLTGNRALAALILIVTNSANAQGPDPGAICEEMKQIAAARDSQGTNSWNDLIAIGSDLMRIEVKVVSNSPDADYPIDVQTGYRDLLNMPGEWTDDAAVAAAKAEIIATFDAGLLDEIRAALTHDRFIAEGCAVPFGDFSEWRSLCRYSAGCVAVLADRESIAAAVAWVQNLRKLAQITRDQPGALAFFVSCDTESDVDRAALHLARHANTAAAECRRLLDCLVTLPLPDEDRIRRLCHLECLHASTELYDENGMLDHRKLVRARDAASRLARLLEAEDTDSPLDRVPETWEECVERVSDIYAKEAAIAVSQTMEAYARTAASRAGVQLVLAVRLHELEHGTLPASLDDLVPDIIDELPTDPATGKPFGYKQLTDDPFDRTFIIYSYGRDGIDNGGNQHPTNPYHATSKDSDGYDFVINHVYFPAEDKADDD